MSNPTPIQPLPLSEKSPPTSPTEKPTDLAYDDAYDDDDADQATSYSDDPPPRLPSEELAALVAARDATRARDRAGMHAMLAVGAMATQVGSVGKLFRMDFSNGIDFTPWFILHAILMPLLSLLTALSILHLFHRHRTFPVLRSQISHSLSLICQRRYRELWDGSQTLVVGMGINAFLWWAVIRAERAMGDGPGARVEEGYLEGLRVDGRWEILGVLGVWMRRLRVWLNTPLYSTQ